MFNYLKFAFIFLFDLIKSNPVKLIFVAAAITFFSFAGTIPDSHTRYNIIGDMKIENRYLYFYKEIVNNEVKYEYLSYSKPLKVKNDVVVVKSYNDWNYLLWGLFVIITVILIIAFFVGLGDDDIAWEIEDSWEEAFSSLIYCEEEDGFFYYFALGRLISKRDTQISRYYYGVLSKPNRELKINGFRDLYRCPKYKTKKEKRETLLNKIGIK
jgi:hypothetical protein